jgi:hypothetical protein
MISVRNDKKCSDVWKEKGEVPETEDEPTTARSEGHVYTIDGVLTDVREDMTSCCAAP